MKKSFFVFFLFLSGVFALEAKTIYVATTGNDSQVGTIGAPYASIQKAVDEAAAGDIIYVRGGTYSPTTRIKIDKAGTANARICLWGYPGERVIIDGSKIVASTVNQFKQARCIYVNHFGDYWHFKNLELCNAKDNGMKLEGSYNIVENCSFYGNNDTGLQIGMYKDFTIEETQSFPITGTPQFNPNYTYCKYNVVINCDSYNNYDSQSFNGSDDGGDADGFACKLFPGPGTEFYGCRAWNNSDDNWDLYMVYHPIVISDCWSWNGGLDKNGVARGNGNGFKLGGGGTSGGAAFSQSVGAHVVKNCVSFGCAAKGFDQNNAYEGMYLFNNVAWNNQYNYRFPTIFMYGGMYMRNNIGWGATASGGVGNHEFLSADKTGSQVPNTTYNSWTLIDGCDPYKENNKVNGVKVATQNHAAQFKDLTIASASASRQSDGSLPNNDFCKLVTNSYFVNVGQNIENFTPTAHSPNGLSLPAFTILYNDGQADLGAFETGDATIATLVITAGQANQTVYTGTAIMTTVYKWGGAATDVTLTNLPAGLASSKDATAKTLTISGTPTASGSYTVSCVGGENSISLAGVITVSNVAPATLVVTSGLTAQEVIYGSAMEPIVFTWGGGATDVTYSNLPSGVAAQKDMLSKTLTISGIPRTDGSFLVTSVGGMDGSDISFNCNITQIYATKVLTGDWYHFQDAYANIPEDLQGVVTFGNGSDSYPTVWDSTYVESAGLPAGCTTGAINLERSGGYIQWNLESLVECKLNIHFTGTRTLKVEYTVGTGETKTWTSASLSKRTMLNWDLMTELGLEPTKKPVIIKFINSATSGGMRVYDFYVKVYDDQEIPDAIPTVQQDNYIMYQTETALIVYGEINRLRVYNVGGVLVCQSTLSQVISTQGLNAGVYVVQIEAKDGKVFAQKFIKK